MELIFDPFDMTDIEVRFQGRPMGNAVPQRIGRHVHPHAREEPGLQPPKPSGIDYLHLVEQRCRAELAKRIDYRDLSSGEDAEHDSENGEGEAELSSQRF